jgi:hypothetical protein
VSWHGAAWLHAASALADALLRCRFEELKLRFASNGSGEAAAPAPASKKQS